MEKMISHGSDHFIEEPEFGYGKTYNDYGTGFYCTENPNMAKEWGVGIDHNGYANQYKITCDGLSIFDLNASKYTMLHWLTTGNLILPHHLLLNQKNICLPPFIQIIKLQISLSVTGLMTVTSLLHLTLLMAQSPTASFVTLCV